MAFDFHRAGWSTSLGVCRPLFYWVFGLLIQLALDDSVEWWNPHCVHHQHDKIMPSGHVPAQVLDYLSRAVWCA
jgi:hypothetical protein